MYTFEKMITMKIQKEIRSFGYAFSGIAQLFKTERHAKFHACATICVILAGFFFAITTTEWIAVVFAIGMVIAAEAFNTAIEILSDEVCSSQNEHIGQVKNIAAGAVLICAIAAAAIGVMIFLPYLIALI